MTLMFGMIGGKWKSKIICTLNLNESLRYNEIKRRVKGVTPPTMLVGSLRELEELGIISRTQYDGMPVRVEYTLTEGRSLVPIMVAMRDWGAAYGRKLAASEAHEQEPLQEHSNGTELER